MRINKISIENFRCFRHAVLDLDADIVAIYGRNGVGKTAIFDALEYALVGNVGRYSFDPNPPDYLQNIFTTESAKVRVDFNNETPQWIEVLKNKEIIQLSGSGGWKNHRDFLYDYLVQENYRTARHEVETIAELIRASMLLSQDTIKAFVDGNPEQRVRIITNLSGNAYLQRCLEKIEKVHKEAMDRLSDVENKAKMFNEIAKDLNDKIVVMERQIESFKKVHNSSKPEQITFDDLISVLKSIGMLWKKGDEPNTLEDVDKTCLIIIQFCDEKFNSISKQSNELVEIETMTLQHDFKKKRFEQLATLITQHGKRLKELQDIELKVSIEKDGVYKEIHLAEEHLEKVMQNTKTLQSLPSIRLEKDKIIGHIKQIGLEIEQFKEKQKRVEEFRNKSKTTLDSIIKGINDLKNAIDSGTILLNNRQKLKNNFAKYNEIKKNMDLASERIFILQEEKNQLQGNSTSLVKEEESLKADISTSNERASQSATTLNEAKKLLAKLKEFSTGSKCPLCGHDHKTYENLQVSINKELESIPEDVQLIMLQIQRQQNELSKIKTQRESIEKKINHLNEEYAELKKNQEAYQVFIYTFQAECTTIAENLTEEKISYLLEESLKLVADRQASLSKENVRFNQESIYLKNAETQLLSYAQNISNLFNELTGCQNKVNDIETQIAGLDITGEKSLSNDDIAKMIDSNRQRLVKMESDKQILQKTHEIKQNELKSISIDKLTIQDVMPKLESEQKSLAIELETFREKCRELNIAGNVSVAKIEKLRKDISKKQEQINNVLVSTDQYKWVAKVTMIMKNKLQDQKQLEETNAQITLCNTEISKINRAKDQINKWNDILYKSLTYSVEQTINIILPDVQRFFKAMIPFPYLFDEIKMIKGESGLSMDLKYCNNDRYSGEPKFYLSSAQANILALSLFLSLASKQKWSKLKTIMLDDPVQHLDDLDAVVFLDNIRSMALGHFGQKSQIIISTCDPNLYLLMLRKYSLIEKAGVSFTGISILNNGADPEIRYDLRTSKISAK